MSVEISSKLRVWEKEVVACLVCKSTDQNRLYSELTGVVRCAKCGFVYTSPRITPAEASELYSKSYFESHSSEEMGYDNYVSDQTLVEKTFNRRLKEIEQRWAPKKGRVLDIGCAAGFFLNTAKKRGWQAEGVEISEYCCHYAAEKFGLNLYCGLFENYPNKFNSFDLITMWDYIEHSFVPDKDIKKSYELLAPGGLLAIATPDLSSIPASLFQHKWIGFKEHEHLYYFTKKNLSDLLVSAGFKVLRSAYAGKYISLDFFTKRASVYSSKLSKLLQCVSSGTGLGNKSFYCNPLDIIYLVSQKPIK